MTKLRGNAHCRDSAVAAAQHALVADLQPPAPQQLVAFVGQFDGLVGAGDADAGRLQRLHHRAMVAQRRSVIRGEGVGGSRVLSTGPAGGHLTLHLLDINAPPQDAPQQRRQLARQVTAGHDDCRCGEDMAQGQRSVNYMCVGF